MYVQNFKHEEKQNEKGNRLFTSLIPDSTSVITLDMFFFPISLLIYCHLFIHIFIGRKNMLFIDACNRSSYVFKNILIVQSQVCLQILL